MVESQALRNTCIECNGEGKIYICHFWYSTTEICPRCDGTGYEKEKEEPIR